MKITLESDILKIDKPELKDALEKKGVSVLAIRRPRTKTLADGKVLQFKAQIDIEIDSEKKPSKKKLEDLQKIFDDHESGEKAKTVAELEAILKHVQEQLKLLKNGSK